MATSAPQGAARRWWAVVLLVALAAVSASCADDGDGGDDLDDVESSVTSDETTQAIRVFEPDDGGSRPVVFALHGIDGSAGQLAEVGRQLAARGLLVFVPDYRTDLTSDEGKVTLARDVECAYRYVRSIASDYGGDLDRPVTFLGWSLGASFAIQGGLDEEIDPSGEFVDCFEEVPRADVIVAVSGCHYNVPPEMFDAEEWTNDVEQLVLVAGEEDTNCPPSQTEDAATELRMKGYDVDVVMLAGADHFAPVFHSFVDGEMVPEPDDPAGAQVVELVVDAVAAADGEG
jgi:dienelactone hydrolase